MSNNQFRSGVQLWMTTGTLLDNISDELNHLTEEDVKQRMITGRCYLCRNKCDDIFCKKCRKRDNGKVRSIARNILGEPN